MGAQTGSGQRARRVGRLRRRAVPAVLLATVAGAVTLGGATSAAATTTAAPDQLVLPVPITEVAALPGVGLRQDRLLVSVVPGDTVNREAVLVEVGPTGAPATVRVEQRLSLTGTGDYVVRERGPARDVQALDDAPPVLNLGNVIWQGFSPGQRELAAVLTLDAGLEAPRLPLRVELAFTPATGGPARPLPAGGRLPGPGTVTVTVVNQTASPRQLPSGVVPAAALAGPLDQLLSAARLAVGAPPALRGQPPPAAGQGLPTTLPASEIAERVAPVVAPMRVTGTITVTGADGQVSGPGTSPVPGGAQVAGTLAASAQFSVVVPGTGGELALDLLATPTLDPRTLLPPAGAASWAAWAATNPDRDALRGATDTLVQAAAQAARDAQYAPYLAADLPGTTSTTFRYSIAPAAQLAAVAAPLRADPVALAVTALAALAVIANLTVLWRLS